MSQHTQNSSTETNINNKITNILDYLTDNIVFNNRYIFHDNILPYIGQFNNLLGFTFFRMNSNGKLQIFRKNGKEAGYLWPTETGLYFEPHFSFEKFKTRLAKKYNDDEYQIIRHFMINRLEEYLS